MSQRPLVVAVELDGHGSHPAAWRASAERPGAVFDPAVLRRTALAAENGGFAFVTFDDALTTTQATASPGSVAGRLDAVVRSAFLAPLTARVGLAPRVDPRGVEPFHLAAQLASLDIASLGRGAWVVGDADQPHLADAVDRVVPESAVDRRREVADVVAAVRRLWDSWEDDAVIKDVSTGRYIDRDRVHDVEVSTPTFSITGASITPRPPQGQLVVVAPDTVLDPAAADVTLVGGADVAAVVARAQAARAAGATRVLAEIEVLLDADVATGERLAALDAHASWAASDALRFIGSAPGLLALLEQLTDAVDGVRLHPAVLSADLPVLTRSVLPRLVAAGLVRLPRAGDTLRDTLDLPRPASVFTRKDAA
ncbi:LLM class flavin-dependent oxidoreductase [Serinibacter arcticus]|uniref:FMNH2-utilizing oxygenase n=1 Tax=Serinibacter arcticus TaxID=1655435 RepID=A0A4Z1E7P7_9MICO|nr:LLM class flavin-dependent oxidoreductase [Serinibacter arcticus]TGO06748.1 FMNH2-utilizing oxygenase [Serinibacter arcticus]